MMREWSIKGDIEMSKRRRKMSKSKRVRRSAMPAARIGILSSIPFSDTAFEIAFNRGFGGTPHQINDDLGYEEKVLDKALRTLNQNVDLIVTVGGLTAALQAARLAEKPFISIVGSTTRLTGAALFHGAVDLESVKRNRDRILQQQQFTIQEDEMCLLLHSNSAMAAEERSDWPNSNIVPVVGDRRTNWTQTYTDAFQSIDSKDWKAVIISADPFFTKTAHALVPIAKDWANAVGGRVCYPFFEYGAHGPAHRHTLHGPKLKVEYERLGRKAAYVSTHLGAPWTIEPASQMVEHH
jgi:hypothetical protein